MQALIVAVNPAGLNLQVLGFFDGTVDELHLPHPLPEKGFKVGKKLKARVLYDVSTSPPRLSLSLREHIIKLEPRLQNGQTLQERYPIGAMMENSKVVGVEPERGLTLEEDGAQCFVHVRRAS